MKYILIGVAFGVIAIVCSDVFQRDDLKDSVDGLNIMIKQVIDYDSSK